MSYSAKYKSSVVANYAEKGNNYQFKLFHMKMSIMLFLFASLCFFTSCYKQKACFTSNLYSGDIKKVLGNCKNSGDFYDISESGGFVYLSESSYNMAVLKERICNFNNIDFNTYSILGFETYYTDSAFFDRNVSIDTSNKIIYYDVKITYDLKRFKISGRVYSEANLVLIPKVTKDYKIKTTQTLLKCD